MNDRLVCISVDRGEVGVTLSTLFHYFYTLVDLTIIGVVATPNTDDADTTLDINDDGSAAIAAISCADADVPGTWKSLHMGGANAPVFVAAGSLVSLDLNSAASGTAIHVEIWALTGEYMA